ncbi:metallophosphoesterase family protein [Pallidibacillus pasinlerensis]|uniref:DNA repair exonuclease n=1 Tax=Pallidibacillus pasinlerensis TaxID=2703818 RepID=A0ABX0A129_9BACI|nr:DNA repair exonuclease [Pallidibacillus pasinlerensis]NCU16532.1 DNA repair exonuclease [Pallidibacillus pasinlerensis]
MKKIKFLHCADLHLDSPFVGLSTLPATVYEKVKNATFASFTKIIDLAIEEKVDFIIIAGDIYDGEDRSIRAQLYFKREMERLDKAGIPAYLVHGNHDHLGGSWTKISLPKNVHVFPANVQMLPFQKNSGEKVHLYGFSYPKKHVFEREIQHYNKISGADFHIGILHGHDTNNQHHYAYTPFSLEELLEKDFDYWALGHIHKREILHKHPYVIYPGNIQGRHLNERGEKGCYIVEMDELNTDVHFYVTASIQFLSKTVEQNQPFKTFEDLYNTLTNIKSELRVKNIDLFLEINMKEEIIDTSVQAFLNSGELLSLLQEGEEHHSPFVWIDRINIERQNTTLDTVNDDFYKTLHKELQEADLQDALSLVFNNPRVKKYLDSLTQEEELQIKEETDQLLAQLLKGAGGDFR